MLPSVDPVSTESWKKLAELQAQAHSVSLAQRFETNSDRFASFLKTGGGLQIDFSKNHLDESISQALLSLAETCQLSAAIRQFQSGERINERENRAVLHPALRSFQKSYSIDNQPVNKDIGAVLRKIDAFCSQVHDGSWVGYSNKQIKHVVNIGIGGSDLGPKMVCQALQPYADKHIHVHFLSNVDANHWEEIRKQIDPETTLCIIASKTFTTDETMTNARTVRQWFLQAGVPEEDIKKHFVAVSTNLEAVSEFGIDPQNAFGFWDWVGGRFSLWSAIGLSIALYIGYNRFEELLKGAEKMDNHFFETPLTDNLPVWMGLLGIWYVNFWGYGSHAVLPYNHYLIDFPRFLQQMIMESNGKQVNRSGDRINYPTCPIYWGEPGTNGQHAFHQLLHQGTEIVPCDFIVSRTSLHPHDQHDQKLQANCFAQSEALMMGRDTEDPYRRFEGNRPSTTIILEDLSPASLGSLIALYEHQVFVQGIIWNIYSFDQWGVELGKELAKSIQSGTSFNHASTESLLQLMKA